MKKTLRVLTAPARLGKRPGAPTIYRVRRRDISSGSECEVVEANPDGGGDVTWPEIFQGPHAAETGIHHLTRPGED